MQPSISPQLTAARDYLTRGWSVIPLCSPDHAGMSPDHIQRCASPGKAPAIPWNAYRTRLPKPQELELVFRRNPRHNVGVIMGKVSGLIGLDIDSAEGEAILAAGPPLPPTLQFTTGKGRRLLFKAEDTPTPNFAIKGSDGAEAINLQSEGRQTVMPPSRHAGGKEYSWIEGHRPGEIDPAPLPLAFLDYLQKLAAPGPAAQAPSPTAALAPVPGSADDEVLARAAKYLQRTAPAVSGQGGHAHTLLVCDKIGNGFGLNDEEAFALLSVWNQANAPPWEERDLRRKIAEARKTTRREPGYLRDEPRRNTIRPHPANTQGDAMSPLDPSQTSPSPPRVQDAVALLAVRFPEVRWAVPGIIPEGATILAGRPKTGKSWLTLGTALAVATGGSTIGVDRIERGSVLYLALEDGPRRLQERLKTIMQAQNIQHPGSLQVSTRWPQTSKSGLLYVKEWIQNADNPRLVVIDTLARIRDKRNPQASLYEEDYQVLAQIKSLADDMQIAIVLVHHTRKMDAEDPLDSVSGTLGLTGAADAILVLKRQRHSPNATLFVTGRDVTEMELKLTFDARHCLWSQGSARERTSPDQEAALAALEAAETPLGVIDVARLIDKDYDCTSKLLFRMLKWGLVAKSGYGRYVRVPSSNSDGGHDRRTA